MLLLNQFQVYQKVKHVLKRNGKYKKSCSSSPKGLFRFHSLSQPCPLRHEAHRESQASLSPTRPAPGLQSGTAPRHFHSLHDCDFVKAPDIFEGSIVHFVECPPVWICLMFAHESIQIMHISWDNCQAVCFLGSPSGSSCPFTPLLTISG